MNPSGSPSYTRNFRSGMGSVRRNQEHSARRVYAIVRFTTSAAQQLPRLLSSEMEPRNVKVGPNFQGAYFSAPAAYVGLTPASKANSRHFQWQSTSTKPISHSHAN